ncbi:conserved hypothetical protein [Mucor ambiguus]|uniref:Uncharacterized protein n=1 Tax=Mucor ambiguus TaxID=91626 RepID=A0A0C9MYZ5_9FUNG|nr:conserved hypothetical protein [Mucor ambiguus]
MSRSTETAKNVVVGSGLTALAGATTGATVAVLRNAPVKQWTVSTGLNCGVFGATFFLVRETFITYQRQKNSQFGLKDSQTRDFDDLFSSAMAGATTGGLLSAAYRGPKSVLSGVVMFGALCTGIQAVFTAGNNWRQESILKSGKLDGPTFQLTMKQNNMEEEKKKEGFSLLKHINLPSWFPIHQLSEDEYNELLDTKLQTLEAELAELEKKLNEKK